MVRKEVMGRAWLNGVVFVSAIAAIWAQFAEHEALYGILKPFTTMLLISSVIVYGYRPAKAYFYAILVALVFCLLGDVLLLNDAYFIFGLASFLIGHIVFSYAFISISGLSLFAMPFIVLLSIGGLYYYFIYPGLGNLFAVVGVYIVCILFMCWQGINLYLEYRRPIFGAIALAVSLFLISDALLAYDKFVSPFNYSGILILLTYWFAIGILANTTFYRFPKQKA
ncbi:lysoplasmalogenase [Cellulophaga sp. F20128]|uniref:lysoplasmalogenase n=1 Tax=Cellulophaga sp. F20128 TaxID=2926413 RepID=UPI001FF4CB0A|nr:lysoplasmalogenase [Cellulophaga sp. F20128]MCK0158683.1 lysoplasmalogenase [Cellulophaga sp. F20128]